MRSKQPVLADSSHPPAYPSRCEADAIFVATGDCVVKHLFVCLVVGEVWGNGRVPGLRAVGRRQDEAIAKSAKSPDESI